jgi:hypothetical protein
MFKIDKEENEISALEEKTFKELGFKEVQNLQEWIAKNPDCLGEPLLIIQKEFDGFSDISERLDLLALDKNGSLVIIENKLDDSGKDVTWQSVKYASCCSNLTKEDVRDIYQKYLNKNSTSEKAEDKISEFFDESFEDASLNKDNNQRIILVSAHYRKEVTSAVMWLRNFDLNIKCFKTTLFDDKSNTFLNFEQIIPVKDTEDFTTSLARKVQKETVGLTRHKRRREFWSALLPKINEKMSLFQNRNPTKDSWLGVKSKTGLLFYQFTVTQKWCRAEICITGNSKEANKKIFDLLYDQKGELEKAFRDKFEWLRLDEYLSCLIRSEISGNITERSQWPEMIDFMVDAMVRLVNTFEKPLQEIKKKI